MFPLKDNLKNIIIDILGQGETETVDLISRVGNKRPGTTKQAVYKALKMLKTEEIVVLNRGEAALSSLWIKKLAEFTERARKSYGQNTEVSTNFLSLKEGEKISYSFKTFEDTDRFWVHAFDLLGDFTNRTVPVLIYNPHEWFLLARTESEVYLFDRLIKNERSLLSLTAEKDPLDLYVKKYFNGKSFQYHNLGKYPFRPRYNVNVFGDFLIEVNLDQKITEKIDSVYKKHDKYSPSVKDELLEIIRTKGKNKLTISRNRKKAETIRKMFRKYFVHV